MENSAYTEEQMTLLDNIGTVTHSKGILLKFCCMVVLYSTDMRPPDQKDAALRIYDDYMAMYGDQIRWTTNPATGRFKRVKNGAIQGVQPQEWVRDAVDAYEIMFHGGKERTDATDIAFIASAKPRHQVSYSTVSQVHCRFPIRDVLQNKVNLPELVQRWCGWLKPLHGHAGLGVGRSFGYESSNRSRSEETDLLLRMPGLQLWNYIEGVGDKEDGMGLYTGPRCADWLISLSDGFLDALGGLAMLEQKAPEGIAILPYTGGAVLQAGPYPQAGSTEFGIHLPYYEKMGEIIEPVRAKSLFPELSVLRPDGWADNNEALSKAWYERFSPHVVQQKR